VQIGWPYRTPKLLQSFSVKGDPVHLQQQFLVCPMHNDCHPQLPIVCIKELICHFWGELLISTLIYVCALMPVLVKAYFAGRGQSSCRGYLQVLKYGLDCYICDTCQILLGCAGRWKLTLSVCKKSHSPACGVFTTCEYSRPAQTKNISSMPSIRRAVLSFDAADSTLSSLAC